jgi:hypothetical protein
MPAGVEEFESYGLKKVRWWWFVQDFFRGGVLREIYCPHLLA